MIKTQVIIDPKSRSFRNPVGIVFAIALIGAVFCGGYLRGLAVAARSTATPMATAVYAALHQGGIDELIQQGTVSSPVGVELKELENRDPLLFFKVVDVDSSRFTVTGFPIFVTIETRRRNGRSTERLVMEQPGRFTAI